MADEYISGSAIGTTSAATRTLTSTDGLVVGRNGYVGNHANGAGILSATGGHEVLILGAVAAFGDDAIRFDPTSNLNTVTIAQGASVIADFDGVEMRGTSNVLTIDGSVTASVEGVEIGASSTVSIGAGGSVVGRAGARIEGQDTAVLNAGSIGGRFDGIFVTSGATNALIDNAGRIMGVAEEGIDAVSATGVTIVNSGSISGGEAGVQMGSESDLRNSGTISTVLVTGEDTGVFNDGTMGRVSLRGEGVNADDNALVNMGSIGSASGIAVIFNDGAVRIGNHGTISGVSDGINGIAVDGESISIHNTGDITGVSGEGIFINGALVETNATIVNAGTITGSTDAIEVISISSASSARVINTGEIIGNVKLTFGADVYNGSGGGTVAGFVDAGFGNDNLVGGDGNDDLRGNFGNDTFTASGGTDTLNGGDGSDTVVFLTRGEAVNINLNTNGFAGGAKGTVLIDIENIGGTRFNDLIGGDTGDNELFGYEGNDTLFAGGGNDRLDGGAGNDTLLGGGGNDVLLGRGGADTIDGGGGNDTVDLNGSGVGVNVNLNTGTNSTGDTITNVENLIGTFGSDLLGGGTEANVFDGGSGNDTLFTSGGNDRLIGGRGNDTLLGGGGADIFVMEDLGTAPANANNDTINDFQDGVDLIDVTAFGFTDGAGPNDVQNSAGVTFAQTGANLVITLDAGDQVTLLNTQAANITDADFII